MLLPKQEKLFYNKLTDKYEYTYCYYNQFTLYKGEISNDLPNGYGELLYGSSGNVFIIGNFVDGQADGTNTKEFYNIPPGVLKYYGGFRHGKYSGFGIKYHDNGVVFLKGEFCKNQLVSPSVIKNDENGRIKERQNYKDSEKLFSISYHSNGQISYITEKCVKNHIPDRLNCFDKKGKATII